MRDEREIIKCELECTCLIRELTAGSSLHLILLAPAGSCIIVISIVIRYNIDLIEKAQVVYLLIVSRTIDPGAFPCYVPGILEESSR